ncbi:hypothetical protein C0991_011824, partial [Blastosporella zonata]
KELQEVLEQEMVRKQAARHSENGDKVVGSIEFGDVGRWVRHDEMVWSIYEVFVVKHKCVQGSK